MRVPGTTVGRTKSGHGKEKRGYESPGFEADDDEVNDFISKAMDSIMQNDSGWEDFFRAKAAPQRVSEVLKQYRFVQRMMDRWVGKEPFKRSHYVIEAVSATSLV